MDNDLRSDEQVVRDSLQETVDGLLVAVSALTERIEALENGYILAVQKAVGHM